MEIAHLTARSDSSLITGQVNSEYVVKDPNSLDISNTWRS